MKCYIKSGPGTGKTTYIVNTIKQLVNQKFIACTFTRKAARELKDRLVHAGVNMSNAVHIGTIHALAMRIWIMEHGPGWIMANQDETDAIEAYVVDRLKLANSRKAVRDTIATGNYENPVYQAVMTRCKETLTIHPDALIIEAAIIQACQRYIKCHIIYVDECQDMSIAENGLVASIVSNNKVFVGDVNQAIYEWRNGKASMVDHWRDEPVTFSLDRSYRFGRAICDRCNEQYPGLEPANDKPGLVIEWEYNIQALREEVDMAKHAGKSCAVLCRYNDDVDAVKRDLCITGDTEALVAQRTIAAILAKNLRVAIMCREEIGRHMFYVDLMGMTEDEYFDLAINEELTKWTEICVAIYRLGPDGWALSRVIPDHRALASAVLDDCVGETHMETLANLERFRGIPEANAEVHVLTVHQAKGLEFDTVCICWRSRFKVDTRPEDKRLYYVACSRAKETLVEFK